MKEIVEKKNINNEETKIHLLQIDMLSQKFEEKL